ncbi:hypothetical protein VTN77DRAFT_6037 [Rasamsonia byssochlamydoides]|uniref:uncharacterized protein n=1 Tax=Rasamsonia byssochlamydoides TaxID=89139 RepID=UPI003741FCE7
MGTETHPAGGEAISTLAERVSHDEDTNTSPHTTGDASQTAHAASSQQSSAPQSFEFVLVTDEGSRRQVRRHAMRQYMRQRRLEGIARLGSSRVAISGWAPRETVDAPLDSPLKIEAENADNGHEEERINTKGRTRRNAPDTRRRNHTVSGVSSGHPEDVRIVRSNKASALDSLLFPGPGGKRDPFDSYPISISQEDHKLINHYVVIYPSMMYKLSGPNQKNPIMEIFRKFALQDRLPFQAMLAIASKHLASVEGRSESVQSLAHKVQSLQLINKQIRATADGPHDGTIYAVATMAVIEKWSKDASIERMHVKGLALMIRKRGGMRGLRASSPFLEQVLYWVDFSCAPKAIVDASLPWTGAVPDSLPEKLQFLSPDLQLAVPTSTGGQNEGGLADYLRACEDFLTFFRCLHASEQAILKAPFSAPSKMVTRRTNLFHSSSRLYSMLTTLPDYDHGIRDVRFIDEYTCLACLFYLNVALYECYLHGQNFDEYMEWLDSEIEQLNPTVNPSISALMWLFLDNGGFPRGEPSDEGERSWFVSRLLRVAKRLEWNRQGALWDCLRDILIRFISTQQECGLGSENLGESEVFARRRKLNRRDDFLWDEDEMRREILGDLYRGAPVYRAIPRDCGFVMS